MYPSAISTFSPPRRRSTRTVGYFDILVYTISLYHYRSTLTIVLIHFASVKCRFNCYDIWYDVIMCKSNNTLYPSFYKNEFCAIKSKIPINWGSLSFSLFFLYSLQNYLLVLRFSHKWFFDCDTINLSVTIFKQACRGESLFLFSGQRANLHFEKKINLVRVITT